MSLHQNNTTKLSIRTSPNSLQTSALPFPTSVASSSFSASTSSTIHTATTHTNPSSLQTKHNLHIITDCPLSPPSTPVHPPANSSLHALSRFITAVIHQLLNRLPSTGNPIHHNPHISSSSPYGSLLTAVQNNAASSPVGLSTPPLLTPSYTASSILTTPAITAPPSNIDYEMQVAHIFNIIQAADKSGGITGPTIITALALIHRIIESREIDTLTCIMQQHACTKSFVHASTSCVSGSGYIHLPNCKDCVKTMCTKYPKAWDVYKHVFEARYPHGFINPAAVPSTSATEFYMENFYLLKSKDEVKHICISNDHTLVSSQLAPADTCYFDVPVHPLAPGNESKLFTVAMMIAHKSIEDWAYHAKGWSKFSGISSDQLVKMERQVLSMVRYDVYMSKDFFSEWVDYVVKLAKAWNCVLFTDKSIWQYPPASAVANATAAANSRNHASHTVATKQQQMSQSYTLQSVTSKQPLPSIYSLARSSSAVTIVYQHSSSAASMHERPLKRDVRHLDD